MKAKEYLRQVRQMDAVVKAKMETVRQLREQAAGIRAMRYDGDRVQHSDIVGLDVLVAKICAYEQDVNDDIAELLRLRKEVANRIDQLQDNRYKAVLIQYYINAKTWEQIAATLHYSERQIQRLHGEALIEFKRCHKMS